MSEREQQMRETEHAATEPVLAPSALKGEPMSRGRDLLQRRITGPLSAQLHRGATPSLLAWSIALGVTLSLLPLPGTTTALCALAAILLRLNPVAIQVANFAAAPLQLAMLLPFVQAGQRMFGSAPLPLTRTDLTAALTAGAMPFLTRFGSALGHAVVAWVLVAAPVSVALQLALRPLFVRGLRKLEALKSNPL